MNNNEVWITDGTHIGTGSVSEDTWHRVQAMQAGAVPIMGNTRMTIELCTGKCILDYTCLEYVNHTVYLGQPKFRECSWLRYSLNRLVRWLVG